MCQALGKQRSIRHKAPSLIGASGQPVTMPRGKAVAVTCPGFTDAQVSSQQTETPGRREVFALRWT